ncbi:Serine carboxypeptidase II-3 [Nymphaea thermarum]|nr:Serine carboxypeptidase II-3 [Nymphaea thermarum]
MASQVLYEHLFSANCKILLFSGLLLAFASLLVGTSQGRQTDALNRLMKARREGKIDTRSWGVDIDAKFHQLNEVLSEKKANYAQEGLKEKDRVKRLPGQPDVDFEQYAGYVTVDEEAGRAFFYYFVEAVGFKNQSKPLLLWLNGGPGCSSLGYGAMEELGPFRVASDGRTLYKNKYAWNNVANVLFLESPAGVGFSYSNTSADYSSNGDQHTALDNYAFLVKWLEMFPEYKERDFYIAGESYAGHFVPQLAHVILQNNKWPKRTITINLKGITIGNGVINKWTDDKGQFDYLWTHALISDEIVDTIHKNCYPPLTNQQNDLCDEATATAFVLADNGMDIYNIHAPLCHGRSEMGRSSSLENFDPCSSNYILNYLNQPDVQEALHANVTGIKWPWYSCSDKIGLWVDSADTLPLFTEFIDNGLRVWIYSGDVDGMVPVTSTRYSLDELKWPVATKWYPWSSGYEVGGYTFAYPGNFTFATIRGAGHQVPSYQPGRALSYIKHFLLGVALPTQGRQTDALNRLMKARREGKVDTRSWGVDIGTKFYQLNEVLTEKKVNHSQEGSKEKDRVKRLPGQPDVDFEQYAGYVTVDQKAGRAFFYYFVEAVGAKNQSKPLLLWLNGGKQPSSLSLSLSLHLCMTS